MGGGRIRAVLYTEDTSVTEGESVDNHDVAKTVCQNEYLPNAVSSSEGTPHIVFHGYDRA